MASCASSRLSYLPQSCDYIFIFIDKKKSSANLTKATPRGSPVSLSFKMFFCTMLPNLLKMSSICFSEMFLQNMTFFPLKGFAMRYVNITPKRKKLFILPWEISNVKVRFFYFLSRRPRVRNFESFVLHLKPIQCINRSCRVFSFCIIHESKSVTVASLKKETPLE